jgi:hypothetical protein
VSSIRPTETVPPVTPDLGQRIIGYIASAVNFYHDELLSCLAGSALLAEFYPNQYTFADFSKRFCYATISAQIPSLPTMCSNGKSLRCAMAHPVTETSTSWGQNSNVQYGCVGTLFHTQNVLWEEMSKEFGNGGMVFFVVCLLLHILLFVQYFLFAHRNARMAKNHGRHALRNEKFLQQ